jgi:excisionase family DNA binding protein
MKTAALQKHEKETAASTLIHHTTAAEQIVWLDGQDVTQLLHISKRTLQSWRKKGILPYYQIGGKILYKKSEVLEILERSRKCAL